jgi:predicted metal-dependent phosphoesterase TrpH
VIRAAMHLHSTWSDGDFTLDELRDVFVGAGCDVAFITDHADAFDQERVTLYVEDCARLSDDHFRFVPGLEFSCEDRMHILGYGVTTLTPDLDPEQVIRHIVEHEGLPVIAHPRDAHFERIEALRTLPSGIEAWNTKYDGRYAPRRRTFEMIARLRRHDPALRAFYGLDLHWRAQYRGLLVHIDAASTERRALIDALAAGRFAGIRGDLHLPSSGELDESVLRTFDRAHRRSNALRAGFRAAKWIADRFGARVPDIVKARLRRIF